MNDRQQKTVCIVGGGSAGMGACYALRNLGEVKIIIVERNSDLGGTATCGWVNMWIESPNPPYFVKIFNELDRSVKGGDINQSWLPSKFSTVPACQLYIDPDALAQKYEKDLNCNNPGSNVTVHFNTVFSNIREREERRIVSIAVKNVSTGEIKEIAADFFIDASADGVLCRAANNIPFVDYFYGEDPRSRYQESLAAEKDDKKKFCTCLNEPSLFFKIAYGKDDSQLLAPFVNIRYDPVTKQVLHPDYIISDGYPVTKDLNGNMYINPMRGEGLTGYEILDEKDGGKGYDSINDLAHKERQYEYWKYIKLYLQYIPEAQAYITYKDYGHTGFTAFMLGIRESYRIQCDRMLTQNDLTKKICLANIGSNIACGSHVVDFHEYGNIDPSKVREFNDNQLQPSGIPYECLIPWKLDNVLVAGRSYGASHIALAARRVSKDMAQLGWAAGNAVKLCLEGELSDIRKVDIVKLQSDDYTGFRSNVAYLQTIMK